MSSSGCLRADFPGHARARTHESRLIATGTGHDSRAPVTSAAQTTQVDRGLRSDATAVAQKPRATEPIGLSTRCGLIHLLTCTGTVFDQLHIEKLGTV